MSRANTVTFKENLKARLEKMRILAKNNSSGHAKYFWVGFDQACFEIQKQYGLLITKEN